MTYSITTEADTRSRSRKVRTWTVEAGNEDDARYEARMRHLRVVGWNASIETEITAIDGSPYTQRMLP